MFIYDKAALVLTEDKGGRFWLKSLSLALAGHCVTGSGKRDFSVLLNWNQIFFICIFGIFAQEFTHTLNNNAYAASKTVSAINIIPTPLILSDSFVNNFLFLMLYFLYRIAFATVSAFSDVSIFPIRARAKSIAVPTPRLVTMLLLTTVFMSLQ